MIVYLSARPIIIEKRTKDYLAWVKEDNKKLPIGPLLLAPDLLMPALRREIIYKRPEILKINLLKDLKSLFGDKQPFYAGFGNKESDAVSYRAVEMDYEHIFIINKKSEIHNYSHSDVLTFFYIFYSSII